MGHGQHWSGRSISSTAAFEQPPFVGIWVRILPNRILQDRPLEGEPDGVGCGVSFALAAAPLRGIQRREQLPADVSGTHGELPEP
jgi:hypothetical protein